jgi:hypothetical protein
MLDPITLAAGEYTLNVIATNEGGTEARAQQTFTVGDVAPRVGSTGVSEGQIIEASITLNPAFGIQVGKALASTTVSINGTETADLTIDPALNRETLISLSA